MGDYRTPGKVGGPKKVFQDAEEKTGGFKKGGKVMSEAAEGEMPRMKRQSGGSVFSSAASGTPRGKPANR